VIEKHTIVRVSDYTKNISNFIFSPSLNSPLKSPNKANHNLNIFDSPDFKNNYKTKASTDEKSSSTKSYQK
jgi:hypothetical protein